MLSTPSYVFSALVLFDTFDGVYLWLSAIRDELKGSAKRQFDISKRLAMETSVDYCAGLCNILYI